MGSRDSSESWDAEKSTATRKRSGNFSFTQNPKLPNGSTKSPRENDMDRLVAANCTSASVFPGSKTSWSSNFTKWSGPGQHWRGKYLEAAGQSGVGQHLARTGQPGRRKYSQGSRQSW